MVSLMRLSSVSRIERTDRTQSPSGEPTPTGAQGGPVERWAPGEGGDIPDLTGADSAAAALAQPHLVAGWNGRNRARVGTAAQGPDRECSGVGVSRCSSTQADETRGVIR
ncbi:hypothetical protein GCM10009562_03340 [Nocardioides aquaticus]